MIPTRAQHRRDGPQRLTLCIGERESLQIFRRFHQCRRITGEGERTGNIPEAGIFLSAEIRRRLSDEAVEGPQPLEALARIVHGLVRAGRTVTQDGDRVFDQFQAGAADFIVKGLFRINSERHPTGLRSGRPWRGTGWKSACRPLPPCRARQEDPDRHFRHPSPLPPR